MQYKFSIMPDKNQKYNYPKYIKIKLKALQQRKL